MGSPIRDPTARDWALALTRQPSVTGTIDEIRFGPWLAERLAVHFTDASEVWTFPVAPGDGRLCVALLVRGSGRETLILTGHYDTVSVDDYGDLAGLATDPEALLPALQSRLAETALPPGVTTTAELRARTDLASGDFLPGRGLLDMKGGLAAGLATTERFLQGSRRGNLLFLAVPDEEAGSAGARCTAPELAGIARSRDLELLGAINLDAIADDGDGAAGRTIALSTIGKLLPTAFVAGLPTHGGYPQAGINAAVLAAAIARRVEWSPELTDPADGPATPPSLLVLRDGKSTYDVTTPATAYAAFNVLVVARTPGETLDAFDALCREAVGGVLAELRLRAAEFRTEGAAIDTIDEVTVLRFETLVAAVLARNPAGVAVAEAGLDAPGLSFPERCRILTERLWRTSGLQGPAVVTGFGSIPYLPTRLSSTAHARRLARAVTEAARATGERHQTAISRVPVFAGISDMSFLREADEASLAPVARNMPGWEAWVCWPREGGIGGVPIVNAGPWGRDYHTRLERIHAGYAFSVLPDLLQSIVEFFFADTDAMHE